MDRHLNKNHITVGSIVTTTSNQTDDDLNLINKGVVGVVIHIHGDMYDIDLGDVVISTHISSICLYNK